MALALVTFGAEADFGEEVDFGADLRLPTRLLLGAAFLGAALLEAVCLESTFLEDGDSGSGCLSVMALPY